MWIQKAEIVNGEIKYNKLGKIKADEIEQGIADKYFVFEQTTASNVWTVTHNLQKKPSVSTVDSSGAVVYGFIEHLSNNELRITFKYPFAGIAYCN
jgi:hypothetical protein